MATNKQQLGDTGEKLVSRNIPCPKCKRKATLKLLPKNFKCTDLICDFCGYLAQVKTSKSSNPSQLPDSILGAAWGPQKERMDSSVYFPLFLVLYDSPKNYAIYYLPADLQDEDIFMPRKPLSKNSKRAGWRGFRYN
ncbi:MAG: hypothetical protein GWO81_01605, partial [Verrucomicrobia bacterium]|nr:hypothetical protein [Verrucomicrobiota bacterium]